MSFLQLFHSFKISIKFCDFFTLILHCLVILVESVRNSSIYMDLRSNFATHHRPVREPICYNRCTLVYVHLEECLICCRVEGEEMSEDRDYVWDHYQESVKVMYIALLYVVISCTVYNVQLYIRYCDKT
jgi:hypothetical protein